MTLDLTVQATGEMRTAETSLRILLIEDDLAHAELIQRAFEDRGNNAQLVVTHTLADARAALRAAMPDLILADWRLPDGESSRFLKEQQHLHATPVVVMTSYGNERMAVEAMKLGALDYIVKSAESLYDMPHVADRAIRHWRSQREQERIQQTLAEREAQFRLLAENSSDVISRHDMRGRMLYVSPSCLGVLGYEPAELIGQSVLSFVHPDDVRTMGEVAAFTRAGVQQAARQYRARHKNGEYIWVETTARLICDPEGRPVEVQSSTRDITERKQSQVALQRAHTDLQEAYDKTIEGWVLALDLRDRETEGHTQRVTEMTIRLARALCCTEEEIVHIRRGALLHDIGKMGIPDEILQKPGPLTGEEWLVMRKHPVYAYQMLSPITYLQQALVIPYYHHERWDGSGYPHGLHREDIPLFARLFAVVDVWDALSSDRPYRKHLPPRDVMEYIETHTGTLFDPYIVKNFLPLIHVK